jgi:chromosome partitioning protein
MPTSIVPSCGSHATPHIVVVGNQKGGSGKSTFAMHIIIALLKAGRRVASLDLDSCQLTLTRYLGNRREWARKHNLKLELSDHCPVSHVSQLRKFGRRDTHDFIVIDTPGGVQHLSLIAHGMADTLITPINDSLVDLDVMVAMEPNNRQPQPSLYAKAVRRALEARQKVSGQATDWIVVRNRLEPVPSRNQHQISQVLEVMRRTLGFRTACGLLERPVYREFFAAGLTAFDPVDGSEAPSEPSASTSIARLEVQNLIREIGLIHVSEVVELNALREIEMATADADDV